MAEEQLIGLCGRDMILLMLIETNIEDKLDVLMYIKLMRRGETAVSRQPIIRRWSFRLSIIEIVSV